ncbi:type IX secretion system protein PorD [Salegentibacter maritimus]|uniref:type IX secretion system protein PorD n=1 Tax=Salegentibacter maritimus TaxID=2794347 RepID=UPI0018E4A468|nr:DUF4835 family protein [Salegentibacter maritimus]MBI6116463.1 DUF4835 family protein [Salegentibacter maritimus]
MRNFLFFIFLLAGMTSTRAQELNCEIVINTEQTGQSNLSVFRTLENSLREFVNQTSWTSKEFEPGERINCSMFITINEFEGESFSGTIQVQSSRPVYGTNMVSPVFNFNDNQFSFNYREYEPLNYSQNSFSNNLVSVVSFYVYTILGLDADTFAKEGGTDYYQEANQIVNTAQQSGRTGWNGADGQNSRFRLNSDLLSNMFTEYRTALYQYHRQGLDVMHKDPEAGKIAIADAIESLNTMNSRRANSLLLRSLFDAKADEISQIFSDGPDINRPGFKETLSGLAPRYSRNWRNLQ